MPNEVNSPSSENLGVNNPIDAAKIKKVSDVVALVRAKMRDYPELNRLTAGVESTDRDIAMGIMMTVEKYNITPPLLDPVGILDFPSVSLLVDGAVIELLTSVGLLNTRNQMSYSDGQGVQVGISDKAPAIMQWLQVFTSSFEQRLFRYKQAKNLRDAMGNRQGVGSEYELINGYFQGNIDNT